MVRFIVTAAVYWGFDSVREHLLLTFQHWAGVSPYTSSFELAETCVFDKQSPGVFRCGQTVPRYRGAQICSHSSLSKISLLSFSFSFGNISLELSVPLNSETQFGRAYPEVTPAVLPSSLKRVLPKHLGILYPSTCVGLRYGRRYLLI